MREDTSRVRGRILLVGLAAGPVLGAGVGVASLGETSSGLWVFAVLVGGLVGAPLGVVTAALSGALVITHATTRSGREPDSDPGVPLCWHLLVPLPATALTAWWAVQSPVLTLGSRVAITATASVLASGWVLGTAQWVMAPLRSPDGGSHASSRPGSLTRSTGRSGLTTRDAPPSDHGRCPR